MLKKRGGKNAPYFPKFLNGTFPFELNFFYVKKMETGFEVKKQWSSLSFLLVYFFPSLIFFLNYSSSEKITKIRNEKGKGGKARK